MNTILTVFKKEFKDTIRDRRTLISAIIVPTIIIPILIYGFTKLSSSIMKKEQEKKLEVAIITPPAEFLAEIDTSKFLIKQGITLASGRDAILGDSLDAMISFLDGFEENIEGNSTGKVHMWYKSTNITVKDRLTNVVDKYEEKLLDRRIESLDLSKESIDPLDLTRYDIAPKKEQIGKLAGGILPYFFVIFCFMGCMYPGLDLITGEKERGTIETLLTVPASKFHILLGKVLTIAFFGMAAAGLTILGLVASLKLMPDIPQDILDTISNMVEIKSILMLLAMIIPLSLFFAGIISAMVVKAKSFKEAQSIVTPISMVIILPAMIGMMPGVELTFTTAAIPIVNIALATKEIVAGTIHMGHYAFIILTLVILAIIAVAISYKQFSKEAIV